MTKRDEITFSDTVSLVEIDSGFCVVIFNSATIYATVSPNGVFRTHIVGELHANIDAILYEDGRIKIRMKYTTGFSFLIYTPHGKIII